MPTASLQETRDYISQINFVPLINRLVKQKKWKKQRAATAVESYKRYLFLMKKYGEEYPLVPTQEIDEIWHEHILFTNQYHQDCMTIFGRYLHHIPENNDVSEKNSINQKYAIATEKLYFKEYGEHLYDEDISWRQVVKSISENINRFLKFSFNNNKIEKA